MVPTLTCSGSALRFWLKGPKAGTRETVLDNMVGYPDNIRLSDRGTFLVGITTPRFRKLLPPFLDLIAPYPALKRALAKVGSGTGVEVRLIPTTSGKNQLRCGQVVPLSWYNVLLPRYALVLELGPRGQVVGSLHDPEGQLTWAISDVFQHRGRTYLGSTDLPFLPVLEGGAS